MLFRKPAVAGLYIQVYAGVQAAAAAAALVGHCTRMRATGGNGDAAEGEEKSLISAFMNGVPQCTRAPFPRNWNSRVGDGKGGCRPACAHNVWATAAVLYARSVDSANSTLAVVDSLGLFLALLPYGLHFFRSFNASVSAPRSLFHFRCLLDTLRTGISCSVSIRF